MDFSAWVDEVGGIAAATALLDEKERTVKSWYYLLRPPSARAAAHIASVTGGRVDYNGIYGPYVAAQSARKAAV